MVPQLNVIEGSKMEITTIATSAVLIDLHISTWAGRKRDKKTTAEVTADKGAGSSKAASVVKNLMSDDQDLDAIRAYAQGCRLYLMSTTLAWADSGTRLLPSKSIFEVTNELESRIAEFNKKVSKFVADYSVKVSAAAFKLGQLFDRSEYPDAQDVLRKFDMRYTITPVPTSGDFRVDVQNDVGEFLKKQFQEAADARVAMMLREPWERAYETLLHTKERMESALNYEAPAGEDGRRKPKLFQSMIDNALDMAKMLDTLNVTKDPQLTDCAARMRRLFSPLDIKSLRESPEAQESVKKQVEDIIGAFNFGSLL